MKIQSAIISLFLFAATALVSEYAVAADKTPAPAAVKFYAMLGNWHGNAQLAETGKPAVKLKMQIRCVKVSAGYAVQCHDVAHNKDMAIHETDLMGVDPVSGQAHWYAVTDQGETHDHLAKWVSANHMQAHYDWKQDGKHMREDINFEMKGKHMKFKTVVSLDGKQTAEFTGSLSR